MTGPLRKLLLFRWLLVAGLLLAPTRSNLVSVSTGNSLFSSYHADRNCTAPPYDIVVKTYDIAGVKALSINKCFTDSNNRNVLLRCKQSASRYTLTAVVYSDAACTTQVGAPSIYQHGQRCAMDTLLGGYVYNNCGQDAQLAAWRVNLTTQAAVLPVLYSDKKCMGRVSELPSRTLPLGVCTPFFSPNVRSGVIEYMYVLRAEGPTVPMRLHIRKYLPDDLSCSQRIIGQRPLRYRYAGLAAPQCLPDLLLPGRYYSTAQSLILPGLVPSPSPTPLSTSAPYGTVYYALIYSYSDTACLSPIYREEIQSLGFCTAIYSAGVATGYCKQVVLPLAGGGFKMDYLVYSTPDCSGAPIAAASQYGQPPPPIGQCYATQTGGASQGAQGRIIASVTTAVPSLTRAGTLLSYFFSSSDCRAAGKTPSYVGNYVTGVCGANWAGGRVVYDKFPACQNSPTGGSYYSRSRYSDAVCSTVLAGDAGVSPVVLPSCTQAFSIDPSTPDSTKNYLTVSCFSPGPSFAPTASPTNPTPAPTASPTVSFAGGYLVQTNYIDALPCSASTVTSFSAVLLGACLPSRDTSYRAYSIVSLASSVVVSGILGADLVTLTLQSLSSLNGIYPGAAVAGTCVTAGSTVASMGMSANNLNYYITLSVLGVAGACRVTVTPTASVTITTTTTAGSSTVTVPTTAGILPGGLVTSSAVSCVAPGSVVSTVTATTFTLSQPLTAAAACTFTVSYPTYASTVAFYSDAACATRYPANTQQDYLTLNTDPNGLGTTMPWPAACSNGGSSRAFVSATPPSISSLIQLPSYYMTYNYLDQGECQRSSALFVGAYLNYVGVGTCYPMGSTSVKKACPSAAFPYNKLTSSTYSTSSCTGAATSTVGEGGTCYNTVPSGVTPVYSSDFWNAGAC